MTRLGFSLELASNKSEENKAKTDKSKGERERKARVEPGVCSMDNHPRYKEVVE